MDPKNYNDLGRLADELYKFAAYVNKHERCPEFIAGHIRIVQEWVDFYRNQEMLALLVSGAPRDEKL